MDIVVDTSAFLAVALDEPGREGIIRATAGCGLFSPEVLHCEIGNALSSLFKRGKLSEGLMMEAWEVVAAIPVSLRPVEIEVALAIVQQYSIYAYDAYFLECAYCLKAPLVTLDKGMRHVAQDMHIDCVEV